MDYVLNMPVMRLFAMLDAGRAIEARKQMTLCDIQAISICDGKYYADIRERFQQGIPKSRRPSIVNPEIEVSQPVQPVSGVEAKNSLIGMFGGR